ncbi:hypothetical protein EVJ58_g5799 [Rhodofomes roseus]|uniref:MFS transporter n=1 Tax=Rhodofomes roseus TaxID=34475 RepID=A0A4Y9YBI9_9APHY|nr:hypothetical protein EVJ58_g5799 [Rhodofomes roseus]
MASGHHSCMGASSDTHGTREEVRRMIYEAILKLTTTSYISYPQLVGARLCLGFAEAGIFPGVAYYLTLWYPRHMVQTRLALFCGGTTLWYASQCVTSRSYLALPLALLEGAFSGILAYGISFMSGTAGLLAWSWLFVCNVHDPARTDVTDAVSFAQIIEGIATIVVGTVALFVLVDFPETAAFLTAEERAFIAWTNNVDNYAIGEEEHFEMRHVTDALLDWQIWLQIILYWCICVPPGLLISLVGFVINISDAPTGVKYFGTFFCVSGSYAAFPGVVAWLGNNLAGQYKRAIGMALQIGIGNFNGAIASNVYHSQEAPRYIMGHGLEIMFIGVGLVVLPVIVMLYKRENDNALAEMEKGVVTYSDEQLRRMGDRAPQFSLLKFSIEVTSLFIGMSRAPSSSGSIAEKADNVQIIDSSPGPTPKDAEPVYPPSLTPLQEAKLWRKVDWHILPILTVMYLCSFLDRGNIGTVQLTLASVILLTLPAWNKYNIALTMYFIVRMGLIKIIGVHTDSAALISHIVCSNAQQIWSSRNCGHPDGSQALRTLMGLVKTYPQLVGARVCLGVAEAGLFPGVVANVYVDAKILEGIATVVVGGVAFLVDFPDTAEFLNEDERAYLIWRKKYDNSTVGEEEHFEMRHLTAIVLDWQIWMQILVYMSIVAPLYGISLFLPSIINGCALTQCPVHAIFERAHRFGYGTAISQLLTVPPYICATIVLMIFALWSDHLKMRSPFILTGLLMCLVGFSINISDAPIGAKYFGTFLCVSGSYAAFPGIVTWLGNNLAGQYKRGVGMAFHIGIGNFSGAIASNIYLSHDAPRYIMGHALELMFIGIGLVSLPITVLAYRRINARRDALQRELGEKGGIYSADELRRMGDRAPDFRYTL